MSGRQMADAGRGPGLGLFQIFAHHLLLDVRNAVRSQPNRRASSWSRSSGPMLA
jgi:hypothetical protein